MNAIRIMSEWLRDNQAQLLQPRTKKCPQCGRHKPLSEFAGKLVKERKNCASCTAANWEYIKNYRERKRKNEKT